VNGHGIRWLTDFAVANLPAEITHLYEEVQAKDAQIQELRAAIQQRDNSLQKFIKLNGSLVVNPKEEPYNRVVIQNYERAQILQEEKIGLVEKAAALVSNSKRLQDCLLINTTARSIREEIRYQTAGSSERWINTC
jgi:inhibitor of growth protein 3